MVEDLPVFNIVLVDIKKAAEPFNERISCVKKNMYDPKLKFVAISYRWGEVAEQVIDTASEEEDDDHDDDYLAHITSFSLVHFYELCQYMSAEVDLQYIDYVWIDAISIDQQNKEHRKATIRYMSQIYEKATYILAVPDLHLAYLKLNSSNFNTMELIRKHAQYIYYIITNHDQGCDDIERIWCYNLLCDRTLTPSQFLLFFRHQLKSMLSKEKKSMHHEDGLACLHLMQRILTSSASISKYVQHHVEKYWFLTQTLNKSMITEIQQVEKKTSQTPHRAWRLDTSSDHPNHTHRPRQLDFAWLNHPWHGLWTTTILPQWNQAYYNTTKELREAFAFLGYLVDDWSNRAWVISEVLIAKKKHTNQQVPMKFIFLLLRPTFPSSSIRRSRFFSIFEHHQIQHEPNPWRSMGIRFRKQLTTRLSQRDFIDMIVASSAKRHEDRFHSILPLWHKYKHVIADKHTIDSWDITEYPSVVLKLFDLMDDFDKLRLLHACSQQSVAGGIGHPQLLFPTFAQQLHPGFLKIYELESKSYASLPLPNITTIHLISPHQLRIVAKQYYRRQETENDPFFGPYYRTFGNKIYKAPLGFQKGHLVAIVLPLFDQSEGSRIHLIGDEKSNKWILIRYIKFFHWHDLFTGPHQDLQYFDIY